MTILEGRTAVQSHMARLRRRLIALLLVAGLSPAALAAAAPPDDQTTTTPDSELARIRRALAVDPALVLNDDQLRFYVEILAKQPSFAEHLRGYDLLQGATRGGNPMTHQEYLRLVTPRELYSTGGIRPVEMLQFALTNWLGKALINRALEDLQHARTEREIREIRERINAELEALKAASPH